MIVTRDLGMIADTIVCAVQTHKMVVAITESAADGNRISKTPGHETTRQRSTGTTELRSAVTQRLGGTGLEP